MKRLAVILLAACLCSACDDFFGGKSDPKPEIEPPMTFGYISTQSQGEANCSFKSAFEGGVKDPLSQANYCWQLYDAVYKPGEVDYKNVKVLIDSWRCREDGGALHEYNHLCRLAIRNVPGFGSIDLPLEQTKDGMYISGNKALLSLTVNKYSFDFIEDENHKLSHYELHVDINVKLSRSEGGDIHIVYDGVALPDGMVWISEK